MENEALNPEDAFELTDGFEDYAELCMINEILRETEKSEAQLSAYGGAYTP